jgi:hypothetical protein
MAHTMSSGVKINAFQASQCSKAFTAANIALVRPRSCVAVRAQAAAEESGAVELSRRQLISSSIALSAAASLVPLAAPQPALANKVLSGDWEKVDLPVDKGVVMLDIGFTGTDPNHGFLLGTRQTLLETFDGGKTWQPRDIEAAKDEGFNYRFQAISFNGDEAGLWASPPSCCTQEMEARAGSASHSVQSCQVHPSALLRWLVSPARLS